MEARLHLSVHSTMFCSVHLHHITSLHTLLTSSDLTFPLTLTALVVTDEQVMSPHFRTNFNISK